MILIEKRFGKEVRDMAKSFALYFGVIYVVVALLELLFKQFMLGNFHVLHYTPLHNVIHWATGLLGLGAAMYLNGKYAKLYAQVFGVVFSLVAVMGLLAPAVLASLLAYPVNVVYNLVHIATGVGGLYTGFGKK